MDISWYGLSCFRIRERGTAVICDPYKQLSGFVLPKLNANIVTMSQGRRDQTGTAEAKEYVINKGSVIEGDPKVLQGPGEYEIDNVFATGSVTLKKQVEDADETPKRNIVFFFELGGFSIGHLGQLNSVPKQSQVDDWNVGDLDVLMVPVGGSSVLDPTQAVEIIGMLEPKVVLPMFYHQDDLSATEHASLEPLDKFLKEFGTTELEVQNQLRITKSGLPEETQIMLLKSGHGTK
ncbi:MAG: MBL fold metallo-hydrolase [Chloroflexota bacterium]